MPEIISHAGDTFPALCTSIFYKSDGVFGIMANVLATYILLFVLFGAFLEKCGAQKFFIDFPLAAVGHKVGGPGKVAVVASGLFGSISGSAIANTVSTGAFTIPMMKKAGFKPHTAGGIEPAASIGGIMASQLYDVPVLVADIEDEPDNTTRFAVIGQHMSPPSGDDRTSLLVFVHNKPGSLFDLLKPLAQRGISMSNIESRPSRRGVWDYVFFIDIDGHRDDELVREAITEIEKASAMVTILGSYPKAVI